MYKKIKPSTSTFTTNQAYIGERIEQKIMRIMTNKEPITDGAPLIYTERKDGVQPQYDIRTDRFEIAVEAMDKVTQAYQAKRENKPTIGQQAKDGMNKEAGGQPIQAT